MKKRLLSFFCAFAMLMSFIPVVSADDVAYTSYYAVNGMQVVSGNRNILEAYSGLSNLRIQPRFTQRNARATYSYLDGSTNTGDTACKMKKNMGNFWGDDSQGNYVKGGTQITLWDLGDVYQIDRVDVFTAKGEALKTMNVSVSTDGDTYTTYTGLVSEQSSNVPGQQMVANSVTLTAPVKARYVKIDTRFASDATYNYMSNIVIWSSLQRISELWNDYHSFSGLLLQGGYTDETTQALTTALADAKSAAEGDAALTDDIVKEKILAMVTAAKGLVKSSQIPMHVLSGNPVSDEGITMYKNVLGESITVNETGATYEVVSGSSTNDALVQGGNILDWNTSKPWSNSQTYSVVYDLKDSYKINRVDIWGRYSWNEYWEYRGVKDVNVAVSADNETFTNMSVTLNTVHDLSAEIAYTTASFDYTDARYVKVTISDTESQYSWPFGQILVMTGSDKTEYKNQVSKANELKAKTDVYTAESIANLESFVTAAESSVADDYSQENIDAQTANVKKAIADLNYADSYCVKKTVVSGNDLTAVGGEGKTIYHNKVGYDLVDGATGATYSVEAGTLADSGQELTHKGMFAFAGGAYVADNGWNSAKTAIRFDLKDTYSICEVDIITQLHETAKGLKNVVIEVSTDDTDDSEEGVEKEWTKVASLEHDGSAVPWDDDAQFVQVKFPAVDAKYVRITTKNKAYQTVFSSILILSDNVSVPAAVKSAYSAAVSEANGLIAEDKYTDETKTALSEALTTAADAISMSPTQETYEAQTTAIEKAIIALNLKESVWVDKYVVSGNDLTNRKQYSADIYGNKIGYNLKDGATGATYVWESNEGLAHSDTTGDKLTQTGMFAFEGTATESNNGWGQSGAWETTIRFDLKGSYKINEVDIISRKGDDWHKGYGHAKIQVSTDDTDDSAEGVEKTWTTVADVDWDNESNVPWVNGNGSFQQIKFDEVDAKYVRVITSTAKPGGQYYQTVFSSMLVLSDKGVVSAAVKKAYEDAAQEANDLLDTAVYTDESSEALEAILDDAVAAIEENPSQEVYEAQTKAITDGIAALDYSENNIVKRYALGGRDWSNGGKSTGDLTWYKNKVGYDIVDAGNKPTHSFSYSEDAKSDASFANADITNKGLFTFWDGACGVWDNTDASEIYLEYDLKDAYALDQIDIFNYQNATRQHYKDVTVQVSNDEGDNKTWTTLKTQDYNTETVPGKDDKIHRNAITLDGNVKARYVKLTFAKGAKTDQVILKAVVLLTKENVFLRAWSTFIAEAKAMLNDETYTAESRANLEAVIKTAEATVEADGETVSEQESLVKKAIGKLAYNSAYWKKKTLVSGNAFVASDYTWYQNNVCYDITKYNTGATSAWTDDSFGELAGASSTYVMAGEISNVYHKGTARPNSTPSSETTSTLAFDLKGVYAIEEVDVLSRAKQSWAPGINTLRVKVSTDGSEWTTVKEQAFDNELFREIDQIGFNQVKFDKTNARYVRVEFVHDQNFAVRAVMILAGDDVAYTATLAKAKALLPETDTYTADSLEALQTAVAAAEAAVAADSSTAVKDEQTVLLKTAIGNVYYKPIYKKRILSGNNWVATDFEFYEKWFGYKTTIVGNSAYYTWDNPDGYACDTDTYNNGQELKGQDINQQNGDHTANTEWDGTKKTEAITYNLNGTYEVNEVHLATCTTDSTNYDTLKIEYQPADSDDYIEIGTYTFDKTPYRNFKDLAIHAVKFDTVKARRIKLTVSYSSHQVIFQNIVILGDPKELSISEVSTLYSDGNALEVESLEGIEDLYVEPQLYNETDETITGLTAFTAIYRGGALVDLAMSKEFSIDANAKYTVTGLDFETLTGMTGNEEVKTFVWQNAKNEMKPILKTVIEFGK